MPEIKPAIESLAKIKVIGVGGSGCSAVNRMVAAKIKGVDFLAVNTDLQALHQSLAAQKLHIGKSVTRGLGAGMDPAVGRKAAEESQNDIRDTLKGADMVFVTCGLGGGTGTGAVPIIAQVAKEIGALTVAVVTLPFAFEGTERRGIADRGREELEEQVDTIITIQNDKALQIVDQKTTLLDAFSMVDDVLRQGVQGISELITVPGLINVDFADVRTIMRDSGSALMGMGHASGEGRAVKAAEAAVASPLLDLSIDGARGVLFTIAGGASLGMHEVNEAAKVITAALDANAKIIWGAIVDEAMREEIKITVIATGFGERRGTLLRGEGGVFTRNVLWGAPPQEAMRVPQLTRERADEVRTITVQGKSAREEEVPASIPAAQKNPLSAAPARKDAAHPDEDLDIPAFIRRKL